MLPIIVASVLSLLAVGFIVWFWTRTPSNLTKRYCIPVTIFGVTAVIALWFFAVILPIL